MSGSFTHYKSHIEVGDMVVVYLSHRQMYPIRITPAEIFQTRFGALKHDQLIGKRYGSRIECSKGFVHILDMTPDLWTLTLPHRTQILYSTDISLILMQLDMKPGSIVLEAGTGSGSLSHSIARTIAPSGKLLTFDFHLERSIAAKQEFQDHGLAEIIDARHRDICSDGFGVDDSSAHAVFLDLPSPWKAVQFAWQALRNGGRICCFSPCIEQVQKTCETLRQIGFEACETLECLNRSYEVRNLELKQFVHQPRKQQVGGESEAKQMDCIEQDDSKPNIQENQAHQNKKRRLDEENEKSCEEDEKRTGNLDTSVNYLVGFNCFDSVGHTGFLTFATKPY